MGVSGADLPVEIIVMIAEASAAQHDFNTLFNLALVARIFAQATLPVLYSVYEQSPAFSGEIIPIKQTICLWRSIIISTLGPEKTYLPYAQYIKSFRLGSLGNDILPDIGYKKNLRHLMFAGEMARFRLEDREGPVRSSLRPLKVQSIVNAIGETVTEYLGLVPKIAGKSAVIELLEGCHIPSHLLLTWITRLPRLASIQLQDGSVVRGDLGAAISYNCPMFRSLRCFFCHGNESDMNMASFLLSLNKNQLQTFEVISSNLLGPQTFSALQVKHAESLQEFSIHVSISATSAFSLISGCTSLRSITLDFDSSLTGNIEDIGTWIANCHLLTHLRLKYASKLQNILGPSLDVPEIRLRELSINRCVLSDAALYQSLSTQIDLEILELTPSNDETVLVSDPAYETLIDSICSMKQLHTLVLRCMQVEEKHLEKLVKELPCLENLSWTAEMTYDDSLAILQNASCLKSITTYGVSQFSFEALMNFVKAMALEGSRPTDTRGLSNPHWGFKLYVLAQYGIRQLKLSEEEQLILRKTLWDSLEGEFMWVYVMDEDELHEEDFSD